MTPAWNIISIMEQDVVMRWKVTDKIIQFNNEIRLL